MVFCTSFAACDEKYLGRMESGWFVLSSSFSFLIFSFFEELYNIYVLFIGK